MQIISHRGFWKTEAEKNKIEAFQRAKEHNFGVETDFRDCMDMIVVSHDPAGDDCLAADSFFQLYEGTEHILALNIKADGISKVLKEQLERYHIQNYFCFDMSVPETLKYICCGLDFFTRESEYESQPVFLEEANGIWMDGFQSDDWITQDRIERYLDAGKYVCIVSSELHGRDYQKAWERYAGMPCVNSDRVLLCTDYPAEAGRFFHE